MQKSMNINYSYNYIHIFNNIEDTDSTLFSHTIIYENVL